jgi:hypothetical protein
MPKERKQGTIATKPRVPSEFDRQGLRSRGWTDGLIRRFLPEPDNTHTRRYYRYTIDVNVYSRKRVLRIERTKKFLVAKEQADKRRISSEIGLETRRRNEEQELERRHQEMDRWLAEEKAKEKTRLRKRFAGYPGCFTRRYRERNTAEAIAKACEAMFALNRYAKHSCTHSDEIYSVKNRLLELLWDQGFCVQAHLARSPGDPYQGLPGNQYWAFRFSVAGVTYSWHQPRRHAFWASERGEPQPHTVLAEVKSVEMTERKLSAGLAVLHWVLGDL